MKEPDFKDIEEHTMRGHDVHASASTPPADPEERRQWKRSNFARLYGSSDEEIRRALSTEQGWTPSEGREPRPSKVTTAVTLLAIAWLTAAVLMLIISVADAFSDMWP